MPAGAQISLVAAVTWDPEPDGELGGDSAPSNLAAALPVIDNVWTVTIDADGNGVPDGTGPSAAPELPQAAGRLLPNVPNPFNPATTIRYEVGGLTATRVKLVVFDVRGHHVKTWWTAWWNPAGIRWSGTAPAVPVAPWPRAPTIRRCNGGGQVSTPSALSRQVRRNAHG